MSDLVNDVKTKSGAAISERTDVAVTHIAARRGAQTSLDDLARATFGTSFPSTPRAVEAAGVMIVWAGPDQWLIIQRQEAGVDLQRSTCKDIQWIGFGGRRYRQPHDFSYSCFASF